MNKELRKLIKYNSEALMASDKSLKAIYEIMFHNKNNVLCETNDGFRIKKITYSDIKNRIISASAGIYNSIGATHNYIALEMENSPEWIVAFWAILMSGNKPYLVNTRYPSSLTNAILKTLKIEWVICFGKTELNAKAINVNELNGENVPPESEFENELAFSSSATSMNEVICFYSGEQISSQILNFKSIIRANPRMTKHYKGSLKQLAFLPFYHVFGLFAVYFWFTFFGRTLVFLKDYSAETILKTCRRHEVTHIFAVPLLWHSIEKELLETVKKQDEKTQKKFKNGCKIMNSVQNLLPSIGPEIAKKVLSEVTNKIFGPSVMFCINGGSYIRNSAIELLNSIGYSMHNGYGMSEIGITSVELGRTPKLRNMNSIGKPFDSVEYKLDEEGVLLVKGSSLCTKKIVNSVEEKINGEWFNTGDYMKEENGRYFILGRKSDVVIGENGENVNPDMVEPLFNLDNVKLLSVLGLEIENEQALSLVVQVSEYINDAQITAIINQAYKINETLPSSCSVKKFYFTTNEIAPPTAVKVSRKQLTNKINNKEIVLTPFSEMKASFDKETGNSPLLNEVIDIIQSVIGCEKASITPMSHIFFDLGATSIQYFSILTKLSEKFSITETNNNDKFCYTANDICKYIESRILK